MNEIHLYAYCPGDPSVGIGDADFTIENIGALDTYEGQRENLADGTPAHPLMLPYSCIATEG